MSGFFSGTEAVWRYLDSIPKFQDKGTVAANFELQNITAFCNSMGNPQNKFPSIHVAGTNGKGTTCHLLEAVYLQAGYKTGLFTSPHLLRYNERFRISGEEVADDKILHFFQNYEEELRNSKLTYFEISTALAFWLFAEEEVDLAIIETGLGGRLDSTNIITPEVSIITSVGLDHQQILGNSEAEIAKEKAGIIKQNIPVVVGNIFGDTEAIISEVAKSKQAKFIKSSEFNPNWNDAVISFSDKDIVIQTQLIEEVNKWNVAAVYHCINILEDKFKVTESDFIHAVENFKGVTGRFEKLLPRRDWYFSGAHNKQALRSTLLTAEKLSKDKQAVVIFSLMGDKMSSEVLSLLNEIENKYYFELQSERAGSYKELSEHIKAELIEESTQKSILKEFESSLVIFTGSFYFYSTVKRWVS